MYEIIVGGEVFGKEDKTGLEYMKDPATARKKFRELALAQLLEWAMGETEWMPMELAYDGRPIIVLNTPEEAKRYLGKTVEKYLEQLREEIDGSDDIINSMKNALRLDELKEDNKQELVRLAKSLWRR